MKRHEYIKNVQEAFDAGRISVEAYDASMQNIDAFCDPEFCYKVTYKCSSIYASDYEVDYVYAESPGEAIEKAIESRKEMSREVDGIEIVDFFMQNGFAVYEGVTLVDWFSDFRVEEA